MRIKIVHDLSTLERKAIANHYGPTAPADRETCRAWMQALVNESLNDLLDELPEHLDPDKETA